MEEDKAAALYENLSKKGLGAARFKQGLGYGAGSGGALENAAAPIAFKKAGADFSTEIEDAEKQPREDDELDRLVARRNAYESKRVVQSIADKLKGRSGRRDRRKDDGTDSEEEEAARRLSQRRQSSDSEEGRHKRSDRRGRGSDSDDGRKRRSRRSSSEDSRKGPADRRDDSEKPESPAHGESSDEDMAREKRIADRRKEDAHKAGKSGRSDYDRREKGREPRREERSEERPRHRSPRTDTRKRSRSRSRDRGRRSVKERSPERQRRRERSGDDHRHSERHDRERRKEEPQERSKERSHHRHSERSSRRERSSSGERGRGRRESAKDKTKQQAVDYAEVIRGYENMSAAERLKARTKHALSQTAVKDSAKGLSAEWERYAFDTTAPLDEDAQQDKYGDDTKAADDTAHLLNTGSTFGIAKAQAVREAEKQAAHDAAIFGLPVDRSGDAAPGAKQTEKGPVFVLGDSEEDEEDRPVIVEEGHREEEPQADTTEQKAKLEPVKVAAPSWKERALKAQQAKREVARAAEVW